MKEQERIIGLALLTLVLMSWLSFAFHTDARFAGSYYGGIFGIAAALLILSTFLYSGIKRIAWLKKAMLRVMSMGTFLKFHIYGGILGSILGLIHTGHKFESFLGIALTASMLGVVVSGFIGQYLMAFISEETREKRISLSMLEQRYRETALRLQQHPDRQKIVRAFSKNWFLSRFSEVSPYVRLAKEARDLSESIADTEYALKSHAAIKIIFSRWVKIHVILSGLLLVLLFMHIWSSFYFGIRWLQ